MNCLKQYRKSMNLTQQKMASLFGCHQGVISNIETGKKELPAEIGIVMFLDTAGFFSLKEVRPSIYLQVLKIAKYRLDNNITTSRWDDNRAITRSYVTCQDDR